MSVLLTLNHPLKFFPVWKSTWHLSDPLIFLLIWLLDQVRPSRKKGPIQSKVGHSLGRRYLGSWVPYMGGGSIFYFWYQMNKSSSSVIIKVYNGYLNTMDQLGRLGDIPQALQSAYKVEILNLIQDYTFVILGVRGSQSWKASKSSRCNHKAEEVARLLQERPDRHRPLPRGDADQGGGRQVQVLHFPPRPSRQLPLKCLPGKKPSYNNKTFKAFEIIFF